MRQRQTGKSEIPAIRLFFYYDTTYKEQTSLYKYTYKYNRLFSLHLKSIPYCFVSKTKCQTLGDHISVNFLFLL